MLSRMRAIIGVGSNKGDRASFIKQAKEALADNGDVQVIAESSYFENPAQGGPAGQGAFLNGAWILETMLGAHQLLHRLQAIERQFGRTRSVVHGARTIDLDLLLCDEWPIIQNAVLELPHPRLHERDFVLMPLNEIAPDWKHPILKHSMADLWKLLNG